MRYNKTANIVGIFATFRLDTHFCYEQNVRRFARGDCSSLMLIEYFKNVDKGFFF